MAIDDDIRLLEQNPFDDALESFDAAAAALAESGAHRAVMSAFEAGDSVEGERRLLAFGHAQALLDQAPLGRLPKRLWALAPRKRTAYVRIANAAARCTRALRRLAGQSSAMRLVRRQTWSACFGDSLRHALCLERVIVDHDVLILGETGTGKEALAQAIQRSLPAPDPEGLPPSASLNAAAIPDTLVESELFGHIKGAFTGADRDRVGVIRKAHGGCLFLDEVGDLPRATQVKLLRVMETDEVSPLGADTSVPAECRYVAATHLDLEAMVDAGEFRRDLYERLAGLVIRVPPLRERREDIPELGRLFVGRYVPPDELPEVWQWAEQWLAKAAHLEHDWPGNVRELQNALRSVVLGLEPSFTQRAQGSVRQSAQSALPPRIAEAQATLREVQDWYLTRVLRAQEGSHSAAARVLAVDRATVRRHLHRMHES